MQILLIWKVTEKKLANKSSLLKKHSTWNERTTKCEHLWNRQTKLTYLVLGYFINIVLESIFSVRRQKLSGLRQDDTCACMITITAQNPIQVQACIGRVFYSVWSWHVLCTMYLELSTECWGLHTMCYVCTMNVYHVLCGTAPPRRRSSFLAVILFITHLQLINIPCQVPLQHTLSTSTILLFMEINLFYSTCFEVGRLIVRWRVGNDGQTNTSYTIRYD